MRQKEIDGILITRPTREDINNLQVGDMAPDCFGKMSLVTQITYRGVDVKGKAYVGYYTKYGENSGAISGSIKEDETLSTVPLINKYHQACLAPVV